MSNTLKRYNSIRRTDDTDDQQGSAAISGALIASETQEELQVFFLSRLRQIIFGENAPDHWFDDLFSQGILSLKDLSAASGAAVVRVGVSLVGPKDGASRTFRTTPEFFVHDPGGTGKTISVWHNGRRLIQTSSLEESGGIGTGYDTINLLTFAPVGQSTLVADYQKAF
jgi:hypothetical protein